MMMMLNKPMMCKVVYFHAISTTLLLRLISIVPSFHLVSCNVFTEQNARRGHNVDDIFSHQEDFLSYNRIPEPIKKGTGYVQSPSIVSSEELYRKRSLLYDLMIQNEQQDSEFFRRIQVTSVLGCVRNQNALKISILNAPDYAVTPTTINICKEYINIDASEPNYFTGNRGIHVINKFINIRCIININKKCIFDAQQKSRHFYVQNSTVSFTRISFINGNEQINPYMAYQSVYYGGSLLFHSSNVIMNSCDFSSNTGKAGGAIYSGKDCNMKLQNVKMINNSASGFSCGGAIALFGYLEMTNVVFINNTAYSGGAICSLFDNFSCEEPYFGIIQMTNTFFANNNAVRGGALHLEGPINIINGTFANNSASDQGGAIVANRNMTIINSTMVNNKAGDDGGAIYFIGSTAIIKNSKLHGNSAQSRGGALIMFVANIVLHDVVVTDNNGINGTLHIIESDIDVRNAFFSNPKNDIDESDILVSIFDESWHLQESRMNFRPSPPPQRLQENQTIAESLAIIATQSSTRQQPIQACVTTYKSLKKQIRLCNNTLSMDPCAVNICRSRILIHSMVGGSRSINLSNKNIVINCQLNSYKQCEIDGQGLSKMFHGSNASVTFRNIMFSNGYSLVSGGAIDIGNYSFVNLVNCSFVNNSAITGAAIMIQDSILYMTGSLSSFINNTGNTPALVGYYSDLNLYDTHFEGNSMTKYGNGILLYKSTINLYNTTFSQSITEDELECNVFVAFDLNEFGNHSSCLDVSVITK